MTSLQKGQNLNAKAPGRKEFLGKMRFSYENQPFFSDFRGKIPQNSCVFAALRLCVKKNCFLQKTH